MAMKRVWHGWTTKENAHAYHQVLLEEVIPFSGAKQIEGPTKFEV